MWDIISFFLWVGFIFFGLPLIAFFIWCLIPTKEERAKQAQERKVRSEPRQMWSTAPSPAPNTDAYKQNVVYGKVPYGYRQYVEQIVIDSAGRASIIFRIYDKTPEAVDSATEYIISVLRNDVKRIVVNDSIVFERQDLNENIPDHMVKRMNEALRSYESWYLKDHEFTRYKISDTQIVYVIENSLVVLFELARVSNDSIGYLSPDDIRKYRLTLDDLTYNDIYEIYETSAWHRMGWQLLRYRPYFDTESKSRSIELVEKNLPNLHLRRRRDDWKGIPFSFCVFETEDDAGNIGRAVFHGTNGSSLVASDVHSVAADLQDNLVYQYKILVNGNNADSDAIKKVAEDAGTTAAKDWLLAHHKRSDNYDKKQVWFDDTFATAIFQRIARMKDASDIEYRNDRPIVFDDRVKYFTFEKGVRDPYTNNPSEVVAREVARGSHSDIERIDYIPIIGKWKNEELMFQCVQHVFGGAPVLYQHSPGWLGQQSFDVFVPSENIAFEYQGKQHFEPVEFFGGEENHKNQVERDKRKKKLSKENGVTLIYVNYWEDVTDDLIKDKLIEAGKGDVLIDQAQ